MKMSFRLLSVKVVGVVLAACLIAQVSVLACTLNVPQDYQEQDQWCWAASSQAVLTYYGTSLTSSQIAQYGTDGVNTWNWLYGSSSNPTRRGVDLILGYFGGISSTPYASSLPQDFVRTEICTNARPVVIRWSWSSGGGHILVVRGLDDDGTTYLMDPWYGPTINSYSWVLSGGGHTWTHSLSLNSFPAGTVNPGPQIISPPTTTNSLLQVNGTPVVLAGEPATFTVGAFDADGNPLSCSWNFGDGAMGTNSEPTHVFTNCGPEVVSVTISDGIASTNASLNVAVLCLLSIAKLQGTLNFAKTNADSCTVKGTFSLPADYSFAGKLATLDIGDAKVSFALNNKGAGHNGLSIFNKPTYNKTTGLWTFSARLKKGSWQNQWTDYGMVNSTIPKPGIVVTNFPVILVLDTEAFMGTRNLHYTAKWHKSGTAK